MSISSLVVMIDKKWKQCHLCFKTICGPKASTCGTYLFFLVTVQLIRKEWLCLLMLLKAGLPRQICYDKLLQIRYSSMLKFNFQIFSIFFFFSKAKFFFISRIYCKSVKFLNSNWYRIKASIDRPCIYIYIYTERESERERE